MIVFWLKTLHEMIVGVAREMILNMFKNGSYGASLLGYKGVNILIKVLLSTFAGPRFEF